MVTKDDRSAELRKKAEIAVQNQFGNEKDQYDNVEDLLHELRVH